MTKIIAIMLGGAVGALLRYLVSGWVQRASDSTFPWGTLAVNLAGSLVLGFLAAALAGRLRSVKP